MAGTAKEEANEVGQEAAGEVSHVTDVAKEEVSEVASEAKSQAKNLFEESKQELTEQASKQQQKVADGLRSLSDELNSMAQKSESDGMAKQMVSHAGSKAGDVASWLDQRDPGSLLEEVRGFARQHPGAFIAVAAGAGVLVGRLTRSLAEEAQQPSNGGQSSGRPSSWGQAKKDAATTGRAVPAAPETYPPSPVADGTPRPLPTDGVAP